VRVGLSVWTRAGTSLQGAVRQVSNPFLDAIYQVRDLSGTAGPRPLLPQPFFSTLFLQALPCSYDRISNSLGDNQRHHGCRHSYHSSGDTICADHLDHGPSPVFLQSCLPPRRVPVGFQPIRCSLPGAHCGLHRVRDLQQGVPNGEFCRQKRFWCLR